MLSLADFQSICRLCLRNDKRLVNLFSLMKYDGNNCGAVISEMVESFCPIKIMKGDDLPEHICIQCFNIVVSLQKLKTESLKSDHHLHEIVNSDKSSIEFIDIEIKLGAEDSQLNPKDGSQTKNVAQKIVKEEKSKGSKRKVSCEVCGKLVPGFFIEFHLNLHKNIRPYKCALENCDKYFVAPTHAKHHYKKVHVNGIIKPHRCDICFKGFNQKSSLITHKTYHFDPQIPCTICGQLYRNKRAIQKHQLVHSNERKYACSECPKAFQTQSTLTVHMRTHTLDKPYSCSQCTKTFAYKCLLKGHTAKYHRKEDTLNIDGNS